MSDQIDVAINTLNENFEQMGQLKAKKEILAWLLAYHMKAFDQEEDKLDQLTNASRSAVTVRAVSVSAILGEVGTMESEYIMESDKSREQEMYDIKQSLEQLSDAAMSTGMNYVDTLRRFQQMKNEETGVKQC